MSRNEISEIRKIICLNPSDILFVPMISAIAGVCFGAMFTLFDLILAEDDSIMAGMDAISFMAMIVGIFLVIIQCVGYVTLTARIYLKMGITRKQMLVATWISGLISGIMYFIVVAVFELIWKNSYSSVGSVSIIQMIPFWGWLIIWIVPVMIGIFIGTLAVRIGKIGQIIWAAVILILIAIINSSDDVFEGSTIFSNPITLIIILIIAVAALIAGIKMYFTMEIKD